MDRRTFLRRAGISAAGIAATGGASLLVAPAAPRGGSLSLIKTLVTTHGNAAHVAWSDDGKTLYLANEEGTMSAVKLDAATPAHLRIAATSGAQNFNWAVDASGDVVVFKASYQGTVLRLARDAWKRVWQKSWGEGHAIATNGSRVWVPIQGSPATLITADAADGRELARTPVPQGWPHVYSMRYEPTMRRLYVGGQTSGVFIYDVRAVVPKLLGKVPSPGWDVAVAGTRVWLHRNVAGKNQIEAWDAFDPAAPKLTGSYAGANRTDDAGRQITVAFGDMAATRDGRRVFVTFSYSDQNLPAGVLMLDTHGTTPALLRTLDLTLPNQSERLGATAIAISPDGKTLAVTTWAWGVFLFDVSGDAFTVHGDGWGFVTTGEAHDVYLDRAYAYVSANENTQILTLATGERVLALPGPPPGDGGWRPFKDGAIIYRSMPPSVWRLHDGRAESLGSLTDLSIHGGPSQTTDTVFDDPYLYVATERGPLFVLRIGTWDGRQYPSEVIATARVPLSGVHAICKWRHHVWLCGEQYGVVALDISNPAQPRQVFADTFKFEQNGRHTGMVAAADRIYAGCGDAGVRIYAPQTLKLTGRIMGLNVNFLDLYQDRLLIVANYWYATLPDGMYVYDVAQNPDAPKLVAKIPNGSNFRVRAFNALGLIARVPLSGVEIYRVT